MPPIVRTVAAAACLALFSLSLAACSPEVGSKEWCGDLEKKSKGDWSANEAKNYAKHCVL